MWRIQGIVLFRQSACQLPICQNACHHPRHAYLGLVAGVAKVATPKLPADSLSLEAPPDLR